MQIFYPTGNRFLTYVEVAQRLDVERQRADQEQQRAEQERQRAQELEEQLQRYRDRFGELPE